MRDTWLDVQVRVMRDTWLDLQVRVMKDRYLAGCPGKSDEG